MKQALVDRARALGFDACRVVDGARPPPHAAEWREWLAQGRHGGMTYLERTADKRADPALVLDVVGEPMVAYQDQTQNDLRWTRRIAGAFVPGISVATAGALGFYNSLALVADKAVLGTVEMRATTTGRSALRFHVFRLYPPLH